jgi:YcaO-like protein with predicted kinase domain
MSFDAAVAQAIAEAIERDALTLWRHQPKLVSERRVDITSVNDPACADLLARFDRAGVACAIWDITSDLEIPAFFVTIVDSSDDARRGLHAASGSGAHPDRGIALSRALTEAAQSRLTLISGARDDRSRAHYRIMRGSKTLQVQRTEIVNDPAPARFTDIQTHSVQSVDQSLSCMQSALTRVGLGSPVVVDLSVADIPASVARVLVPGLEGPSDAPGYKPGARALALETDE